MKITIPELEYIAKQVIPDITIEEVPRSPVGVCVHTNENGQKYIVWANDFWDFFEKVVFIFDTLPYDETKDETLITELYFNILGILFNHLSNRYNHIPMLSVTFRKLAIDYNYQIFNHIFPKAKDITEFKEENEIIMYLCNFLVLYHELGHIVFDNDKQYKENMIQNLTENLNAYFSNIYSLNDVIDTIFQNDICPDYITKETIKKNLENILEKKDTKIIEELICDYYAISKVVETTYLAIEDKKNHTLIMNNMIIKALPIYYIVISSYAFLCNYWDYIVPQFFTLKKINYNIIISELKSFSETEDLIRNNLYKNFLMILVFKIEENLGFSVNLKQRITPSLLNINRNINLFSRIFKNTICEDTMNMVFKRAIKMRQKENMNNYCYEKISESTLIVSWLSNQYHNNLGLQFFKKQDFTKALSEFNKTILICENLNGIGYYHNFTARAYNNITSVFLKLAEKFLKSPNLFINYIYQAKKHSDIAVDIICNNKNKTDMQHAVIFQNAGTVYHYLKNNHTALQYYMFARSIKFRISKDYQDTHALTDFSIAKIYYEEKNWSEAKKYCKLAKDFYSQYVSKDNINRKNCEELYKRIMKNKLG